MSSSSASRYFGLHQVYPDPNDATATRNAELDIIAVHGLGARSPTTWIAWKVEGEKTSGDVNWLSDPHMLPAAMPRARILTYDWNADYDKTPTNETLLDHADTFLDRIHINRKDHKKRTPIMFIASCFGGLLVAETLTRAADQFHPAGKRNRPILDSVIGIVTLGTPFGGSWKTGSEVAQMRIDATAQANPNPPNGLRYSKQLIQYLKMGTAEQPSPLDTLTKRFFELISHVEYKIPAACFYETLPTQNSAPLSRLPRGFAQTKVDEQGEEIVVFRHSACLPGVDKVGLNMRHNMMHKFNSPSNEGFQSLRVRLHEFWDERQVTLRTRRRNQPSSGSEGRRGICHIPYPRNEDVVLRPDLLSQLDNLLPLTGGSQSAALWGLGGNGKTQLALDYAYRRSEDSSCSVFWVHAENEATFANDYKAIATALQINVENISQDQMLRKVRTTIQCQPHWVLVVDNADNLKFFGVRPPGEQVPADSTAALKLREYIPSGPTGTVLWTTRDGQIVGSLVGSRRGVRISRMDADEAKQLLFNTSSDGAAESQDEEAIEALLEELQWHPLAVYQAGSYMRNTSTQVSDYLSMLREGRQRWKVLNEASHDRHRREGVTNSILEIWRISIENIRQRDGLAYKILHIIAYLDNQKIQWEVIQKAAAFDKVETVPNEQAIKRAVKLLGNFSFLSRLEQGEETYEMHKLVQEGIRFGLENVAQTMRTTTNDVSKNGHTRSLRGLLSRLWSATSEKRDETYFIDAALWVVRRLFPHYSLNKTEMWVHCEKFLVHCLCIFDLANACSDKLLLADLMGNVAGYLHDHGRWGHAITLWQREFELRLKEQGQGHPRTLYAMACLANTHINENRTDEAEQLIVPCLRRAQKILGETHQFTLWAKTVRFYLYKAQGQLEEAEKLSVQVLEHDREAFGEMDRRTLISAGDLAWIYQEQGRYSQAEQMFAKVLDQSTELLGEMHPLTMNSASDIIHLCCLQGLYEQAEQLAVKLLEQRKEISEETDFQTLAIKHNLSQAMYKLGKTSEAILLMEECLEQQKEVLGLDNSYTRGSQEALDRMKGGKGL